MVFDFSGVCPTSHTRNRLPGLKHHNEVTRLRRLWKLVVRRFREARMFAKAMHSTRHPILAQIIPIRRCNLACAYCNEYDAVSPPVPLEEMLRRIDRLADLGTTIITLSGGEPLLHPDLDELIRHIRQRGAIATLITNGYLLTPERIQRLNRAGLDYLQISIDNALPDETSKKSLKVLDRKLQWLAKHAEFSATINSVLGSSVRNPEDAHGIAVRARSLGFGSTVGILHDHSGQLRPLAEQQIRIYERILNLGGGLFSFAQYDRFQANVSRGLPNNWHCRAGARFLYICEDGLVHYCSQQRGRPGIPLAQYSSEDMERAFHEKKGCAPFCTISCVHQTSMLDSFREQPRETLAGILARRKARDPGFEPPPLVRLLDWMFLRSSTKSWFSRLALRVFGIR
jgi:MoaA/NifB/PqqE/SkfB family radical SAM enzyme